MDRLTGWAKAHRKFLAALAGGAITVAEDAFGSTNPWVLTAIMVATVIGVYGVPNKAAPAP